MSSVRLVVGIRNRCDGSVYSTEVEVPSRLAGLPPDELKAELRAEASARSDEVGGNHDPDYDDLFGGHMAAEWEPIFWHDITYVMLAAGRRPPDNSWVIPEHRCGD